VSITAPPRSPRSSDPVTHGEFEALVEALIEEARNRAQRRRRRNAAVMTLVALVGGAVFAVLGRSSQSPSASPALAAPRSVPTLATGSKLAFISEPSAGGYCGTVYVMNADGSGQRRLANGGIPGCAQEGFPAWSPDGRKIAFVSRFILLVTNADGSGQRKLARRGRAPAWSPDGRKIAIVGSSSKIYVTNADGSGQRWLTRRGSGPAWSPDGRRIAFVSGRDGNLEIYVMSADGSEQRNLTRNAAEDRDPVWSPDGRGIAFIRNWQVWIMNADGSGQRRLTRNGADNFDPGWSPDGQMIAFERGRRPRGGCGPCPGSVSNAVYVMNADGSAQQRLTRGGSQPRWSPDGRMIAFVSGRDGNRDIFVMNADGSGQRNLTRDAGRLESQPVWSPALR